MHLLKKCCQQRDLFICNYGNTRHVEEETSGGGKILKNRFVALENKEMKNNNVGEAGYFTSHRYCSFQNAALNLSSH